MRASRTPSYLFLLIVGDGRCSSHAHIAHHRDTATAPLVSASTQAEASAMPEEGSMSISHSAEEASLVAPPVDDDDEDDGADSAQASSFIPVSG